MDKRERENVGVHSITVFTTIYLLCPYRYITDRTFGSSFAFPLIRHSSNSDYTRTSAHFRPPRTTIIFFSCCYRILFPFLIRRRTQHGEMKVKAAHYFFTSEQEQNQMFHICSCSLQHYHEKAKGVFQCSTAHCFRIEMETSVKTPTCLCQMSPWWGHNARADSHLTNHTLAFSAIPGERRGNNHSRAIPLLCPLGQMFLHHHYRFHNKGMCSNAVSEWTGRSTEI